MCGFPDTMSGHRIRERVGWGIAMCGVAADGCLWKGTGVRLKCITENNESEALASLSLFSFLFLNQLISMTSVAAAAAASARTISFSAIA
jgi:hypothetical protein